MEMYCRCHYVEDASQLFDKMCQRDVVTWTSMIAGLAHNGYHGKVLECFWEVRVEKCNPNSVTVASVLLSCRSLEALREGKEIHGYVIRGELDSYVYVQSVVMDMHSKSGCGGFTESV